MTYMYGGTILLVNLSESKVSKEPTTSYSSDFLGGRGINIKLLYDGVPPGTDPLDPTSPLIFGVGPLCGTPVPASRVEVTAKSPEPGSWEVLTLVVTLVRSLNLPATTTSSLPARLISRSTSGLITNE